jgi:hypothetical protein
MLPTSFFYPGERPVSAGRFCVFIFSFIVLFSFTNRCAMTPGEAKPGRTASWQAHR